MGADAYQATAGVKASEVENNTQKIKDRVQELNSMAKAVAHLEKHDDPVFKPYIPKKDQPDAS